jgi:thiol:disulfide interchange protein DsbD
MFLPATVSGQIGDPVSWTVSTTQTAPGIIEVVWTARVEAPWRLYSQNTGKGGPIPTSFTFNANPLITLRGKPKEDGNLQKAFDTHFSTNVLFYSGSVNFVQDVAIKSNQVTLLSGTVNYMVCSTSQCLPPVRRQLQAKLASK